nr:hypothetical protein [Chloroflexaceae bacterium]
MSTFSIADLRALLAPPPGLCLSLFLPTLPASSDSKQNQVSLKNLLRRAEELLAAHGLREAEQKRLLEPVRELRTNLEFWQQAQEGLALFCGRDVFYTFHLPISIPEQITSGHYFTLRPLVPLFSGDGTFYVLALSRNHVRLLRSSWAGFTAVPLPGAP